MEKKAHLIWRFIRKGIWCFGLAFCLIWALAIFMLSNGTILSGIEGCAPSIETPLIWECEGTQTLATLAEFVNLMVFLTLASPILIMVAIHNPVYWVVAWPPIWFNIVGVLCALYVLSKSIMLLIRNMKLPYR
jgi:hypothetical protein